MRCIWLCSTDGPHGHTVARIRMTSSVWRIAHTLADTDRTTDHFERQQQLHERKTKKKAHTHIDSVELTG